MYTRDYDSEMQVPGGYSGVALAGGVDEPMHEEEHREERTSSLFSFLPDGILSFFGKEHLSSFKIGLEEILIIATAAFLLFSKDADIECAIMLLVLLFVF